jgi:hypothetical protein
MSTKYQPAEYQRNLAHRVSLQKVLTHDWRKYGFIPDSPHGRQVKNGTTFIGQASSILRTEERFELARKDASELLDVAKRQLRSAGHQSTADALGVVMVEMAR